MEAGKLIPPLASVGSFPTRITGDVLWCFFDKADGLCGAESLPFNAFPDTRFPLLNAAADTYTRELPYSFDFLVENFMDPAHSEFQINRNKNNKNALERHKAQCPDRLIIINWLFLSLSPLGCCGIFQSLLPTTTCKALDSTEGQSLCQ
jgi:hypothetical protein